MLVFTSKKLRSCFKNHFFTIVCVGGATVSGLLNPNSKTQALPIFTDSIKKSTARITVILLGEVDTGFVIWYRSEKYKMEIETALNNAIANYQNLLKTISVKSRVICISAPLPTIRDGQSWGEIANERRSIHATQRQRTELTIQFNNEMKKFCKRNEYSYLSFDEESLGEDGLVREFLINSDPNDHHYEKENYGKMIATKLKAEIETK